jgi:hypothetical protein
LVFRFAGGCDETEMLDAKSRTKRVTVIESRAITFTKNNRTLRKKKLRGVGYMRAPAAE